MSLLPPPGRTTRSPEEVLLHGFCEEAHPKPAQPWPQMLSAVRRMLAAGWSEEAVAWALREAPNVSVGTLTFVLNKRVRERAGGRLTVTDVEAAGLLSLRLAASRVRRSLRDGHEPPQEDLDRLDAALDETHLTTWYLVWDRPCPGGCGHYIASTSGEAIRRVSGVGWCCQSCVERLEDEPT